MPVPETMNLGSRIEKQLPPELVAFLRAASRAAQGRGQGLYLVGGAVRDLLLERRNLDLDLVVEGDAIDLAQALAGPKQARVTAHHRFGTAKIQWADWSVDLAAARAETYARPGALPSVKPGSINSDLARRDFTINAMAVALGAGRFGELLDPYHGKTDLGRRLIRVLHDKSFIDDATRIWRALRYEQRLDFKLEPATLKLLRHDLAMLDTISGDRIRHELELVLKEERPENTLLRADGLGVLAGLHPSLTGDIWLATRYMKARELSLPDAPPAALYLSLLDYRLASDETEQLISCLRLPKSYAQALRDTGAIKAEIRSLSVPGLAPSLIYARLHGCAPTALAASSLAADSPTAAEHIELYLNVLRYVKPALTGEHLKKMGVPEGPKIKEILQALREARLDGKAGSKKDEEAIVREWKSYTHE